jgi:hypothetical protein
MFHIHTQETGKIMVILVYTLVFKCLDSKQEDKSSCSEWQQVFPVFSLLLISLWKFTIVVATAAAAAAAVLCFPAMLW